MKVFIGMEKSGRSRQAFRGKGHNVISCDLLPADDNDERHVQGDVFRVLAYLRTRGWAPDLAIFHPDCTYMTVSAAWAYKDGPYHQELKPGTLAGANRRAAQAEALAQFQRILDLDIERIAVENPAPSFINTAIRPPDQIIHPYMFGDDASKGTGIWLKNLKPLDLPSEADWVQPRVINGKKRWANQTDSGQNRLSPSAGRAAERADTYFGIAQAFTQWAES